jgi:hypothetical protein
LNKNRPASTQQDKPRPQNRARRLDEVCVNVYVNKPHRTPPDSE